MPRGIPGSVKKKRAVVARGKKSGVKAVVGYLTTDGRFSDNKEVAAFMEAVGTVKKLIAGSTALQSFVNNYIGMVRCTKETAERELARAFLMNADILTRGLGPIAKRVASNKLALAKLKEQQQEQSVASSQQSDLLDTEKLVNKYL